MKKFSFKRKNYSEIDFEMIPETSEIERMYALRLSILKILMTFILSILSAGLIPLILFWNKGLLIKLIYNHTILNNAKYIQVLDKFRNISICKISILDFNKYENILNESEYEEKFLRKKHKIIEYNKNRFFYNEITKMFCLIDYEFPRSNKRILDLFKNGIDNQRALFLEDMFGKNKIKLDILPVTVYLLQFLLDPIYLMQVNKKLERYIHLSFGYLKEDTYQ